MSIAPIATLARGGVWCDDAAPMARPDQWLKQVLAHETPLVTHQGATFERAPEIATTELRPDRLLRVARPAALVTLAAPWCTLRGEVTVEGKMPRDHLGPAALQRTILRREARQVQRIELEEADPDPLDCGAWVVAPYVPEWLRAWESRGRVALVSLGAGCWSVTPSLFPLVWIAANELPLREELIPFLVARTGKPLKEFVRWVHGRREPAWFAKMVYSLPEVAKMIQAVEPDMTPEEQDEVITAIRASLLGQRIENAAIEKGVEKGMGAVEQQFQRRLGRAITAAEHRELLRRVDTLGAARLGDVVLDLTPEALAAWLADPDAT
jgi:hypothetical protein